ncbi:hypothetical protein Tco_0643053, partial [Tanacetum coccineum]
MSAMLSSDATFLMEMFPFGHCPEGNGDVSSVCSSEVGVKFRHNLVRDILVDICSKVGI